MKEYDVIITAEAEKDLQDIFRYIALELLEPTVALNLCDSIEREILKLSSMPDRHALYKKEPWFSRGLRFFPVSNYLIFYIVRDSDSSVHVLRVMYSKQNIHKSAIALNR